MANPHSTGPASRGLLLVGALVLAGGIYVSSEFVVRVAARPLFVLGMISIGIGAFAVGMGLGFKIRHTRR